MTIETEQVHDIDDLRQEIDQLDADILAAVQRRTEVSRLIGKARMARRHPPGAQPGDEGHRALQPTSAPRARTSPCCCCVWAAAASATDVHGRAGQRHLRHRGCSPQQKSRRRSDRTLPALACPEAALDTCEVELPVGGQLLPFGLPCRCASSASMPPSSTAYCPMRSVSAPPYVSGSKPRCRQTHGRPPRHPPKPTATRARGFEATTGASGACPRQRHPPHPVGVPGAPRHRGPVHVPDDHSAAGRSARCISASAAGIAATWF